MASFALCHKCRVTYLGFLGITIESIVGVAMDLDGESVWEGLEFLEVVRGILQVHNLIEIDLCNDSGCLGVQWKNKNTR